MSCLTCTPPEGAPPSAWRLRRPPRSQRSVGWTAFSRRMLLSRPPLPASLFRAVVRRITIRSDAVMLLYASSDHGGSVRGSD